MAVGHFSPECNRTGSWLSARTMLNCACQEAKSNVLSEVEGLIFKMTYSVYILCNEHNRLYIGHTNNLTTRLKEHYSGVHGAKFIKDYGDFKLVYSERFATRSEAMKRERQFKGWTRAKKEALITGDLVLLKKL